MAYLGNTHGPRESDILNQLGPGYFGCTPVALEDDISHHRYAEARGEIAPVHVDETGRPFVEFKSPKAGEVIQFVLEDHGYAFKGDIVTFSDEENARWRRRHAEA